MPDEEVLITGINSDTPSGVKYFAECALYPELLGVGDTEFAAYVDLDKRIKAHISLDIYGRLTIH